MVEARTCPSCGAELPAEAPDAPCPACLMKLGLESWASRNSVEPTIDSPAHGASHRFDPPTSAELADRFPQFEILELLGCGGMGAVYKARQKSLDRLVALKIINPAAADEPGFAERFAREARALARLNHQNIVGVYEFGKSDALFYLVMEFVDGTNLRQVIQSHELTPEQALQIVPQVCEALQFAHDEGVVHRDIKPENILIGLLPQRGSAPRAVRVKIADFGLAKLLGQSTEGETSLTATHQIMGTPRYMAPEQMQGSRAIDHRADIYSLGVVFYEMLTGELPLGRFAPPSQLVDVDARLDEVVLRSLEKEPELRYQHASDVQSDVTSIRDSMLPSHRARCKPADADADHDDFVLRNPRLPQAAQWICVYAIVCRPVVSLLMFLFGLTHPALSADSISPSTAVEVMVPLLLWPLDLAVVLLIFIGGFKLRALRPWGPRLIKIGVGTELVIGAFAILGMIVLLIGLDQIGQFAIQAELADEAGLAPEDVALLTQTDDYPVTATDVLVGFLGICTIVLDVAMFIWLRKNANRLPLVEQPRLTNFKMSEGSQALPAKNDRELAARRLVAGPALGLALVGLIDLLPIVLSILAIPWVILVPVRDEVRSAAMSVVSPRTGMIEAGPIVWQCSSLTLGQEPSHPAAQSRTSEVAADVFDIPLFPLLAGIVMLLSIPIAILLIVAGIKMRKLELYPLALIATLLALLPCHIGCLVGCPIGIWSLTVLLRNDVREAFYSASELR